MAGLLDSIKNTVSEAADSVSSAVCGISTAGSLRTGAVPARGWNLTRQAVGAGSEADVAWIHDI